jgi:hypothetical protein
MELPLAAQNQPIEAFQGEIRAKIFFSFFYID